MKTIIFLFILLSVEGMGQENFPPRVDPNMNKISVSNKDWRYPTIRLILHFYKQYSQECWNDSTRREREGPGFGWPSVIDQKEDTNYVWIGGGGSSLKRVPRIYYTHREFSFPDFMNWLQERMK